MSELARLSHLIKELYDGDPWHGPSIKDLLQNITAEKAGERPIPKAHTIWEILQHMIGWREIIVERLQRGKEFEVMQERDWPGNIAATTEVWSRSQKALELSQKKLLEALSEKTVPSEIQLYGIYSVFQHDLYHAGQIAVLKKSFAK